MAHDSNYYYYYCYYAGDVRVMADACALPKRVAAIDFGTGSCSLAYTLGQDDKILTIPLSSDLDSPRVPTAILLEKKSDSTIRVLSFGIQAQESISKINIDSMPDEIIYFECFKMMLFHEAVSSNNRSISSRRSLTRWAPGSNCHVCNHRMFLPYAAPN